MKLVNATATNSTSATPSMEPRTVFSTLDIMSGCNVIILVLCLQVYVGVPRMAIGVLAFHAWPLACVRGVCSTCMPCVCCSLFSSLLSPKTSNVLKRPLKLSELHSEAPEISNLCAKLFGLQAGAKLDAWMCKNLAWLLGVAVTGAVIQKVWRSVPTFLSYSICVLVLSVPTALCLDVGVLKKLIKVAGVWYFILSIIGGQLSASLIWGPRYWMVEGTVDTMRQFSYICSTATLVFGIIVSCAFLDAIPPRIAGPRARVFLMLFITILKSGSSIFANS